MDNRLQIVLRTHSEANRHQWRQILQSSAIQLLDQPRDAHAVDLIITDEPLSDSDLAAEVAGKFIGVVTIGDQATEGDVALDSDFTTKELQLACELLGEIVRLRRERAADQFQVRELKDESRLDYLTEIGNRRAWDSALKAWPGGLAAVLDIDRFKQVNDQFGHAAGDGVLQRVARRLSENVRDNDFAARLGGDEFGLLLGGVDAQKAFDVAERIRQSVTQTLADGSSVTASLGFVMSGRRTPEEIMRLADLALIKAKSQGRNQTASAKEGGAEANEQSG